MATLVELEARKAAYLAAELKILESQDYSVSDGILSRRNRRAELEQVRIAIADIDSQITALQPASAMTRRVYRGVPGA